MIQFLSSKIMVFAFGGAILGFMLFNTIESAMIGAVFGVIISFLK